MELNVQKSVLSLFRENLAQYLSEIFNKKITSVMLKNTPDIKYGDLAFPVFILGEKDANLVKDKINLADLDFIEKIEVSGPYLNFFLNRKSFIKQLFDNLKDINYSKNSKKVLIEYSQANTHKAFHVGHLRGTSLGEALSRILKFYGYDVIQVNYQGDTGIHVAKWLWCYLNYHKDEEPPENEREKWIASIYVDAVTRLKEGTDEEDTSALDEVRILNQKIEDRSDKFIVDLWQKTRKWSLDAFSKIYEDLGANFDNYFFESNMEAEAKQIVKELLQKGIVKIDQGAHIVDLEEYDLGVWVLLRKDGTTLYSAKDLALAKKKQEMYDSDYSFYVVGAAQSLHFKQLFKTLELMGFSENNKPYLEHLSYAEIRLPTGKMSSRTGKNILYSDMKEEIFNIAYNETKNRHPDWNESKIIDVTNKIVIAALKFDMLAKDSNKVIVFDSKNACRFDGETGPYLQYVGARINSLLKKFDFDFGFDLNVDVKDMVYLLLLRIDEFYDVINVSAEKRKVFLFVKYVVSLAKSFNEFYHSINIKDESDENLKKFYLSVVELMNEVYKKSLHLLAIPYLEEM